MTKLKLHNPSPKCSRTHFAVIADGIAGEELARILRQQGLEVRELDSRMAWKNIISEIKIQKPQSVVSINCEHYPPCDLFEMEELTWLNLNLGAIPKYSGMLPVQRAMMNGDMELGIVLHQIRPSLNRVDIIAKSLTPILFHETGFALYGRALEVGMGLIKEYLAKMISGDIEYLESFDCCAEDWAEVDGSVMVIDWDRTAFDIHNLIRAFTCPYGGAISRIMGHQIRIRESRIDNPFNPDIAPGTILKTSGNRILDVATGSGIIRILDYEIRGDIQLSPGDCFESEIRSQIPEGVALEQIDS